MPLMQRMIAPCLLSLMLAACQTTGNVTDRHACALLPSLTPQAETARYIVENDRPFARQVAKAKRLKTTLCKRGGS